MNEIERIESELRELEKRRDALEAERSATADRERLWAIEDELNSLRKRIVSLSISLKTRKYGLLPKP